jgi:P27 family predicted phage terminase small subunit
MKKGAGKHWTKDEIEAREAAEKLLERKDKKGLYAPSWLTTEGKEVFARVVSSMKGLEILDNIDTENLATYCDAVANYRELSKNPVKTNDEVKAMQAYARLQLQFSDKLGLTPAARARLAKRIADKKPVDAFGKKFD